MTKLPVRRLFLFQLLSLADLFLTWHLLKRGSGRFYESNPLAEACYTSYGWLGLALFKLSAVLLVGALAVYISWHRPQVGARLLLFACSLMAGVVLYSWTLSLSIRETGSSQLGRQGLLSSRTTCHVCP